MQPASGAEPDDQRAEDGEHERQSGDPVAGVGHGGRPRRAPGAGADALTPAERRVAEIAASGATNREIAGRLYLSPKTVEMHLRSAYRTLDLAGRSGLASALG